jgi:hypothetical protein
MDRGRLRAWLAAYRRAWEAADTPAVLGLFTADATYRSHPLRPVHASHDGIAPDPAAEGRAEGYERAWRAGDPEAAAALYASDAHYRSEPFRDPHPGRAGVLAYTRRAYATEAGQDPTSAPRSPPATRPPSSGGAPCSRRAARPPSWAPRS